MNQSLVSDSRPVVLASVEQLYAWSNDGGIAASSTGAGYAHQKLTPRKIVSFRAPVSVLENFDFDLPESAFPVLIELYNIDLCDRTFISFEEVRAVHFRSEAELEAYERFPTPSFGMSEVALLVSGHLFEGLPNDEPIDVQQIEFDEFSYQKLESMAGSILFVCRARETDVLGTQFAQALMSEESFDLPPLLQVLCDYRWSRGLPESELGKFVFLILDYSFKHLGEYRDIDSDTLAINWSERLLELTRDFDSSTPENVKTPSERFKGMANILTSSSPLKDLSDSSNAFQVFQYAVLIALMRRDAKAFDHWIVASRENCEEVKLAAAFLLGLRCGRRSVLDRKIRTSELDRALSSAISESMLDYKEKWLKSIPLDILKPLNKGMKAEIASPSTSTSGQQSHEDKETTIVINGEDLVSLTLDQLLNGKFSITVRGSKLQVLESEKPIKNDTSPESENSTLKPLKKPRKSTDPSSSSNKSKSTSNRKKVGSYADPSNPLFETTDSEMNPET